MKGSGAEIALLVGSAAAGIAAAVLHLADLPLWDLVCSAIALALAWGAVVLVSRSRRSDRLRLAEMTELDMRRADQAAALSHEIRTPLAVIQGAAELLAEQSAGVLTPTQLKFVTRIGDNAIRMQTFAEQMLISARLEAGLFTINRAMVDLRILFRDVVEELSQVSDRTIMLVAPGAPVTAPVDAQLIRQVLINLITNASSSITTSGDVEVRIAQGEDEAIISVSDGGTGMTQSQRENLFQRFASGRPLGNGTGIGLFISQQFVKLHGGRIYVDTITGKGTTMMFTLPLALTAQPEHSNIGARRGFRLLTRTTVRSNR